MQRDELVWIGVHLRGGATRAEQPTTDVVKGECDNYSCRMEILPSARKHGISDDDIRHAFEHAVVAITVRDRADFSMIVGPDQSARLLEIGVLADDDNDYVIHAMPARPKYLKLIRPNRGKQL